MEQKVFFSYAWRDMGIAQRIYFDLKRSGVNVWRDRVDSPPTGNFREQYLKVIDNCSHFIMLDTVNYRKYSNWCKDEIDRFFAEKEKDPSKELVICLVPPKGEKPNGKWRKEELVPNQDLYKYINFGITSDGNAMTWQFRLKKWIFNLFKLSVSPPDVCIYDNEKNYVKKIVELCAVFGVKYIPWLEQDCEQDLLDELKENANLSEKDREIITSDFENLRYLWSKNNPTTEIRIRNFIMNCESLSYTGFTPHMLLLDYLSAQKRFKDCEEILNQLKKRFPDEPRIIRWLGTVCLHLNKYDEALLHYNKSIEMSNKPKHKKQKTYLNSIMLNICAIYRKQGNYESALSILSELNDKQNELSKNEYIKYIEYQTSCNTRLNNFENNFDLLNDALQKYPESSKLYELLGNYYLRKNDNNKANEKFNMALENIKKNDFSISNYIINYVSLADAYSRTKSKQKIREIQTILKTEYLNAFDHSILTDEDRRNIRLVDSFLEK